MYVRIFCSVLVMVLLVGASFVTPASTLAKPVLLNKFTVQPFATGSCWVKVKTPMYQSANKVVIYDHEIQCSKSMKEIVITGYITWAPLSGGGSMKVGGSDAYNKCTNRKGCHVRSTATHAGAGIYHGWTSGSWVDEDGQRRYVPQTQSNCLTVNQGPQRTWDTITMALSSFCSR
jgi:hypothetical protein